MDQKISAPIEILHRTSYYVIDLDGVVYEGSRLIPGSAEAINFFRSKDKNVVFLTNNSIQHPRAIAEKLTRLGIECSVKDVLNSALAAALFIAEKHLDIPSGIFVIGSEALREILNESGIRVSSSPDTCSALLAGMDLSVNYRVIAAGLRALNREVPFLICNRDASYPGEDGILMPGCGAIVGALEGASLRRPDYEIGKPSVIILNLLLRRLSARLEDCLVFGDTLETDIRMAHNAGIESFWISPRGQARISRIEKPIFSAQFSSLLEVAALMR